MNRRDFLSLAATLGASLAWCGPALARPRSKWREQRELFAEGVGSGDPQPDNVLLWTRYSAGTGTHARLAVEVAEDEAFTRVVGTARATATAAADWTCRVLVAGLAPRRVYWYRFFDANGGGSRIGRTITAPAPDDARPVRFSFVSCQNVSQGAQNAYRRMIFEDERASAEERLGFVLHLGDFVYEVVWYPEDRPQGMYDRKLRDITRYPHGEKFNDYHLPVTLDDYRALYRSYLHDPDLQDARARWPFVPIWDNHEFSWMGYQSIQKFPGHTRPAQTLRVAANQAWFEYQPARVRQPRGTALDFKAPKVTNAPITRFDEHGFGDEPNNRAAVASLTTYRGFRYGRHLDLLITDQHSYRGAVPTEASEADAFTSPDFPNFVPQEAMEILDAGRAYDGGKPPASIRYGAKDIPNFRRDAAPHTILGAAQKKWFLDRLRASKATWKVWGNSVGTLEFRADPQNLPEGVAKQPWPGAGYAGFGGGDYSGAFVERAEIYDLVRAAGITGFATVSGDRHSFWAGLAAKALPPQTFDPVGVAFITGSISAPGLVEAFEHRFPKDHPLRALFVPHPAINLLLRHGVRSCLEYQRTGDLEKAVAASNPDLSPHLSFVDMGGHGYATVRLSAEEIECEFVCIPRPLERAGADGGPLRYRVSHRAKLWKAGERPVLEQTVNGGSVT